jgi:hypothetical protein
MSSRRLNASKESGKRIKSNDRTSVDRRQSSTPSFHLGGGPDHQGGGGPSFAHIKASMAPILVSLTYPNSDASDPNIDAFREDNWFAPTFKEPANAGIVRSETRKSANIAFCMTFSSGWDDRHRVAS